MKRVLGMAAVLASIAVGTAHAQATTDFTCRNEAAEITCTSARCKIESDAFTPMSLSRNGNKLAICAYSGCWSGPLDLIRARGDQLILHAVVGKGIDLAVVYDRSSHVATMMWSGYAQPMTCG